MIYSASKYSFKLSFSDNDYFEIDLMLNDIEIGRIEIEKDEYDANIKFFEIYEDFRGQGHYKNLLAGLIASEILNDELDCDCLVSNYRIASNVAYNKWLGCELKERTQITIQYDEDDNILRLSSLEGDAEFINILR